MELAYLRQEEVPFHINEIQYSRNETKKVPALAWSWAMNYTYQ